MDRAYKQQWDRMVSRRKRRGIPALDYVVPDWRDRINPETLDMADHRNCMIGQLWPGGEHPWEESGYRRGLFELSASESWVGAFEWAVANGFDVDPERDEDYGILTRVWLREFGDTTRRDGSGRWAETKTTTSTGSSAGNPSDDRTGRNPASSTPDTSPPSTRT